MMEPLIEIPSTYAPVHVGQVRYCRTLDGDDVPNPGLYLVVEKNKEGEDLEWRCLALQADHDLTDEESDGDVKQHSDHWLRAWTEPFVP